MPAAPDVELIARAVVTYCRETNRDEPYPDLSTSAVHVIDGRRYVMLRTAEGEPLIAWRWTNQGKLKYLRRGPAELYGEGDR